MRSPEIARNHAKRLIRRAREAAESGNQEGARRAFELACRYAYRAGGLSGSVSIGSGRVGIVLGDGTVAISPVRIR